MKHPRSLKTAALAVVCAFPSSSPLFAGEEEREIALADVPANAVKALVLIAGTADFEMVEVEEAKSGKIYEAKWNRDGRTHEAAVDSNRHLLFLENTLGKDELPKVIAKTMARLFLLVEFIVSS